MRKALSSPLLWAALVLAVLALAMAARHGRDWVGRLAHQASDPLPGARVAPTPAQVHLHHESARRRRAD